MTTAMIDATPATEQLPPLEIVVRDDSGRAAPLERDVVIDVRDPGATVGDLVAALGWDTDEESLSIDGAVVPTRMALRASGVRRGSIVAVEGRGGERSRGPGVATAERRTAGPVVSVRVVSGPDAGRATPLAAGGYLLGRSAGVDLHVADPLVSARHALVEVDERGGVTVTDLAPVLPSRLDGAPLAGPTRLPAGARLAVGASELEVVRCPGHPTAAPMPAVQPVACRPIARAWTTALHRPPRDAAPPPASPVDPPRPPPPPPSVVHLGLAAVITTLVASGLVAVIVHQPAFVLLGAVGAVGTLAAGVWQTRRDQSSRRSARRAEEADLARFAAALARQRAATADRLRAEALELPDAIACAVGRTAPLWQRRPDDPNAYTAVIGRGERNVPPVLAGDAGRVDGALWAMVEAASHLSDVPVAVGFERGAVVGIAGSRDLALAVARGLVVQLVTAHGPADLMVAGVGMHRAAHDPDGMLGWLRWLPHSSDPATAESLVLQSAGAAGTAGAADAVVDLVDRLAQMSVEAAGHGGHLLVVVDEPALLGDRDAPLRRLLSSAARSVAVLVVASATAELPSMCTTVVEVHAESRATVREPGGTAPPARVLVAGASAATARSVALALAGLCDPEQPGAAGARPRELTLAALLGPGAFDPDRLAAAWSAAGPDPRLHTVLGAGADGPVEVDLVRDGPHALIAGTTGAGKSELLRSLIAGLAASTGPDDLSFVLIDYKGGSAFDACSRLPHVVGMVTDLDEQLAERALRSLHAELSRRELILRDVGAPDLTSYRAQPGRPLMARLVVVVDEFATLATDLPGFVTSLVGVAQRGRSLGVHVVLATQRPAGAVSDDIRANTNLRVALRVQDASESVDVIGDAAAASLPRHRPGRALVRFGPSELVPLQVATITAPLDRPGGPALVVRSLEGDGDPGRSRAGATSPSALDVLVDAAQRAATTAGCIGAHRPWAPSVPTDLRLEDLPEGDVALLDDPDRQAQLPWRWSPDSGHLLCIGTVGVGVSTALASVVLALATSHQPSGLHVYAVGGGSQLPALAALPHVGAVIDHGDDERQARLLRLLVAALVQRTRPNRTAPRPAPIVVVVDRLAAWRTSVAERLGPELADVLDRLLAEGPSAGIVFAGGLDRPSALPMSVGGAVGERLLFRLSDPADAASVGVRPALVARSPAGRAVLVGAGVTVQLGRPGSMDEAVERISRRFGPAGAWLDERDGGRATPIGTLSPVVDVSDLPHDPHADGAPWTLPIGISDATLRPVRLVLHPDDHFVIAGSARSGKSSALVLLAHQLRRLEVAARLVAVMPRRSPLAVADVDVVLADASQLGPELACAAPGTRVVVLVDDAELVDDADLVLSGAATGRHAGVHLIAAGRTEALRVAYGHWTQAVRRQRRGVVLAPADEADGDVLSALLPRRSATPTAPGRGYLVVDGRCEMVQLATLGHRGRGCSG